MASIVDIRDYDMGMLRRFQFFYPNTVWVNRASIAIEEIRDNAIYEGNDIRFPVIILRRTACPTLYKDSNPFSQYKTGDRRTDGMSAEDISALGWPDDLTMVNSIYELKYEIEILSADRDNFDELVIEAQENLIRFPYLTFDADDDIIKGQSSHLIMDSCQDNSDLDSFDTHTPLYRASIGMTLRATIFRKYRRFRAEEFSMLWKTKIVNSRYESSLNYKTEQKAENLMPDSIRKVFRKNGDNG